MKLVGRRTRLIGIAAAVAMLGATGGAPAQATTRSLQSRALAGRLHYIVELPKGYATSRLRYPVVYFLHGLPASATAYQALGWVESALRATGRKASWSSPKGPARARTTPSTTTGVPGRTGRPRWRASFRSTSTRTTAPSPTAAGGRSSASRRAATARRSSASIIRASTR